MIAPGTLEVCMDLTTGAVVLQAWLEGSAVAVMSCDLTWREAAGLAGQLATLAGVAADCAGATPDEVELHKLDIELTETERRARIVAELGAGS